MPKLKRKTKARADGEGTIYKRDVTRKDGSTFERWEGKVIVGRNPDGSSKRKTVYGKSQNEVLEKIEQLKKQLLTGTYSSTTMTVEAYIGHWLEDKAREVESQTVDDYRYELENYAVPKLGKIKLSDLNPLHIRQLVSELTEEVSIERGNRCRRMLSIALNQAVRWELISRNPCNAVRPSRTLEKDMIIWNPDEAQRFLEVARCHSLYALFYLTMSTGLRRGEVLGLRWRDIRGNRVYVKQNLIERAGKLTLTTPKTKTGLRSLEIAQDVLDVLEEHRGRQEKVKAKRGTLWPDRDLIFPTRVGTLLRPRNLLRTYAELQEATRVRWLQELEVTLSEDEYSKAKAKFDRGEVMPHARFHDLRHYHASVLILIEKKTALEVAARLGHTNPSFTIDTYAHLFDMQRSLFEQELENDAPSILACFELLRQEYISAVN